MHTNSREDMKAISVKQPWATLIVKGIKPIENRTWKCPKKYIGQRVLIHASGKPLKYASLFDSELTNDQLIAIPANICLDAASFPEGAIIGSAVIVDCVINHTSVWAEKSEIGQDEQTNEWLKPTYNWVLADAIEFEKPIPAKGKLSFWNADNY